MDLLLLSSSDFSKQEQGKAWPLILSFRTFWATNKVFWTLCVCVRAHTLLNAQNVTIAATLRQSRFARKSNIWYLAELSAPWFPSKATTGEGSNQNKNGRASGIPFCSLCAFQGSHYTSSSAAHYLSQFNTHSLCARKFRITSEFWRHNTLEVNIIVFHFTSGMWLGSKGGLCLKHPWGGGQAVYGYLCSVI